MRYRLIRNLLPLLLFIMVGEAVYSQPLLRKDLSTVMEIPEVTSMASSPAHLYILSNRKGLAVFRSRSDSLQWLFTSDGMQRRGNTITADIRFAYLFGNSRRLTVLEPTSVLGVYSSTQLPTPPRDAQRIGNNLYVALGDNGLGMLPLSSPSAFDSTVTYIGKDRMGAEEVIDLESSTSQLFVLTSASKLYVYRKNDDGIAFREQFNLPRPIGRIFLSGNALYGSESNGTIHEIGASGELSTLGQIGEEVSSLVRWQQWILIRGRTGRLWSSYRNRSPMIWKSDGRAKNFITATSGNLWLSEYNTVTRITEDLSTPADTTTMQPGSAGPMKLKPIEDVSIPNSRPVLVPILLENDYPAGSVRFTYRSNVTSARIRGNGFYWQPGPNSTGEHSFTIIASSKEGQVDSTSFTVEIRSFNAPPRFAPIRPVTIAAGESFKLPISARDPDGSNTGLVRYLGVDMPENASINEKSGLFNWTPAERQTGEHTFKVIATDQYGAAASVNITIRVIENPGGGQND